MLKYAHQDSVQTSAGTGGPINVPAASLKSAAQLGVTVAEFDDKRNVLSIDLLNTFPEWYWQGEKVDFKDIDVGLLNNGVFTELATLSSKCYAQANYEKAGGIVDLQLNKTQLVRDGLIAFRVQRDVWVGQPDADGNMQPSKSRIVLLETPLTAQTDQRGIYLNEGQSKDLRRARSSLSRESQGIATQSCSSPNTPAGRLTSCPISYVWSSRFSFDFGVDGPSRSSNTSLTASTSTVADRLATTRSRPTSPSLTLTRTASFFPPSIYRLPAAGLPVLTVPTRSRPGTPTPPQPLDEFDNQVPSGLPRSTRPSACCRSDDAFVDEFIPALELARPSGNGLRSGKGLGLHLFENPVSLRHDLSWSCSGSCRSATASGSRPRSIRC